MTMKIAVLISVCAGLGRSQDLPEPPVPPAALAFQDSIRQPPKPPLPPGLRRGDAYRAGQSALDRRDYERAVEAFNRVVAEKAARADGALYWRAYAENRLGKQTESLASLAQLRQDFPSSHWLDDAKALEVEVMQASGNPVSPEASSDEDLKLLALNGLMESDPERGLPILEKLLKGTSSPKVKERALFVLAQSHSAKSRDFIVQIAKGSFNPDLQAKAVEYLGAFGGRESSQALADIYKGSNDLQVKRAALRGFMISGSKEALLAAAKNEANVELKTEAIRDLGAIGGSADLLQLYTADSPLQVKRAILQGLMMAGNGERIAEIARTDRDVAMRREAIRQLGPLGRNKAVDLGSLYSKEPDVSAKREILNVLAMQGDATSIIQIARHETEPNLKRDAVRRLSMLHTKEANDYLAEMLGK